MGRGRRCWTGRVPGGWCVGLIMRGVEEEWVRERWWEGRGFGLIGVLVVE